jgi:hypothetical protein
MNPHESFYHSLILSKLWLCEKLEQVLDNENIKNPEVNILASWDSLLAFMMLTRRPKFYKMINAYDIDPHATENANKICDHWQIEYPRVFNHTKDINTLDFTNAGPDSIFINCSVDQINNTTWYNVIPDNSLICIQSTDLPVTHSLWDITQSYNNLKEITDVYPVSRLIYHDSVKIKYDYYNHYSFSRHMLIGIK